MNGRGVNQSQPGGVVTNIQALGYRSLRYVSQSLRPFQVLVGPNASGKSSFLDVVAFLGDIIRGGSMLPSRATHGWGIPLRAPDAKHLTWMRRGGRLECYSCSRRVGPSLGWRSAIDGSGARGAAGGISGPG